ncbi:hypothetical protein KBC03_03665 [Patescibacteria group bacterium]|nr:hypothetical protein [Patescibacteria group bacterium]
MLLTIQQFTLLPLREKRSHMYMLFTCVPEAKNNQPIVTLIDIVTSTEDETFLTDLYKQLLLSK